MRLQFQLDYGTYILDPEISKCPQKLLYEHAVAEWPVKQKLWHPRSTDMVLDIGAHLGGYTLNSLACGAKVIAFEPGTVFLEEISAQAAINGFQGLQIASEVVVSPVALVNQGEIRFSDRLLSIVGSQEGDPIVHGTTLDIICETVKPTLIKIDVEGAELDVLEGGSKSLPSLDARLLIECHNCIFKGIEDEVIVKMQQYGFRVVDKIQYIEEGGSFVLFER